MVRERDEARAGRDFAAATRSATSSPHAASSSRTARAAPPGIDEPADRPQRAGDAGDAPESRRARGARSATSDSRSRVAARYGSCSWPGRRRVNEIWLLAATSRRSRRWPKTPTPGCDAVPADQLERRARTDAPQGVVAFAAPIKPADVDELLADPAAFLVALDGVTDPQNLGAVMRTAETAGATGMVLPRHRAVALTPAVAKAAAGALEYLPVAFVSRHPRRARHARSARACGASGSTPTATRRVFDLPVADQPLVLVLGAEGRGLSRLARSRCEVVASIPMHGHIESLNVERGRRHRVFRDRAATASDVACWRAGLAQSVEHFSCKEDVVGSIPTPGSNSSPITHADASARNASTSRANSAWCWNRNPCAASG